ncbi:MAG: hypothetical protein PHH82_04275 [Candidatus ainarchaeum sp.]|nr:hypothetical protein [Candidatus ainarchaeum sp.]
MDRNMKILLIVVIGFFAIYWIIQNFSSISFKTTSTFSTAIIIAFFILLFIFMSRNK